jgi:hypothetical protein
MADFFKTKEGWVNRDLVFEVNIGGDVKRGWTVRYFSGAGDSAESHHGTHHKIKEDAEREVQAFLNGGRSTGSSPTASNLSSFSPPS